MRARLFLGALALLIVTALSSAAPPDPLTEARKLLLAGKHEQAAKMFADFVAKNRFDGRAWADYSFCLHSTKQFAPAIEASKKAIELGVNPAGQMYNNACSCALMGKRDDAITWLSKSLDAGFTDQETLE